MRSELAGPVYGEHLDEVPAVELDQPVGRAHAVVVEGARRQRKACFLEDSGGTIEAANSHHHVINRTPGCHACFRFKACRSEHAINGIRYAS